MDPISKHLAGFLRAIHRGNDVGAARCHIAGAMKKVAGCDQFVANVLAIGGDVDEAVAEVDRIALAGPSHEFARRVVLARIMRGEPIQQGDPDAKVGRMVRFAIASGETSPVRAITNMSDATLFDALRDRE